MKKLSAVFAVCFILISCVVPAFAADPPASESEVQPSGSVVVNNQTTNNENVSTRDLQEESERSGFPQIVQNLFGTYQPRTQTVVTYAPDGTSYTSVEVVPGLAGLDWYWISGVLLFALVLFGLLRFVGVIVKR